MRPFSHPLDRRVRVHDPDRVTSANTAAEADPREAGLAPRDVEAIWASVVALYRTGLHPAIALAVRRRGKLLIDRAIGHLRGNAPEARRGEVPVPIHHSSLFNLFSASKAVTAMVVHLLDDRGLVHLDDRVVEYIPEFGKHGKQWITLRHILTHRAGIPTVRADKMDLDLLADRAAVLELLCDTTPSWRPGRRLAYHALTGGFVLGEVVERVTGRDVRQVLVDEILEPLGFEHLRYGVEPADVPRVAEHAFTGPPPFFPASFLLKRALGIGMREAVEVSNDPRFLTGLIPAGNVIGTANEAGRFFELLLREGELDGVRVFDRRTVRRAVAEQSYLEMDLTLGLPVRYGMGFMLGGRTFSLYGPDSNRAFGHMGFTNVLVYADPERDLSVGFMTTGKPFLTPQLWQWIDVVRTIARLCPRERAA